MITAFDKLNLRPQERRLVVIAAIILFAVLNVWLVRPKFAEWKVYRDKLATARLTAAKFSTETNNIPAYQKKLEQLQNEGSFVPAEEQSLSLAQAVLGKAAESNVYVQRQTPGGGGDIPNNPFFVEQRITLSVITGEKELVDFLVKLGNDPSLIRVRDMDLRADPSGQKLMGTLTVIGRYQKKPSAKPEPAAPTATPRPLLPSRPGRTS